MLRAHSMPGVAAANGRIYTIGGGLLEDTLAVAEEYDPGTDTWRARPPMPTARTWPGAAVANRHLYVIGGIGNNTGLATVEETPLPILRQDIADGEWISPARYVTTYDFTSLVPRGVYSLTVSSAVSADGIEIAPYSGVTFTVDYAGYIADTTPPSPPSVSASANGTTTTIAARWSASDPQSAITLYSYGIGTTPAGTDVVNWTNTSVTNTIRSGLSLLPGQTYYVSAKARNEGGLWSEAGVSNEVIAGVAFTATSTATATPTATATSSWTATSTATPTASATATSSWTATSRLYLPIILREYSYGGSW